MKKILTIIGPTASGKTAISVALAQQINGEIVGLDSRQIYKGMAIGTAQPSLEEMEGIPHHLIGVQHPKSEVAAGHYAEMVIEVVEDIINRKKTPIICGGAGLYYRAITKGIFEGSFSDADIRKKLEKEYDVQGSEIMLARLKEVDPDYAENVHSNNKKRLVRALEIYELTEKTPSSHFQDQKASPSAKLDLFTVYLDWDRSVMKDRIAERTEKMLWDGWVQEVQKLLEAYPNKHLHPLDSIGYRQIISFLNGELSESEMKSKIIIRTRQFAKRQIQWFRREKVDLTIEMNPNRMVEDIVIEILKEKSF
ncbi:MAG: tRNA (adenosine(37)-N6)-dimethylallyltransferase MiaA [Candidatus Marinimicrobia bacterium]|nr:tRNA (adenosine(37)-N6)-dimethylallyltransferase MiaA [Candidatus Neomarinimicrobiota bacterium]MBL7009935.1 tRNA (adenosine(37)-N6)-dimethylallyltransferase MiaA [Candidatus Neomarinimicrobiota bacterium]MBL7029766.1 tRNA (adenosine(37)-N6)-dimethylallyltransferase MiaA [Candidatus Neomarinimicrobiota bacterium]